MNTQINTQISLIILKKVFKMIKTTLLSLQASSLNKIQLFHYLLFSNSICSLFSEVSNRNNLQTKSTAIFVKEHDYFQMTPF